MTDEDIEKIIKRHMSLQMNLAGIRADIEDASRKPFVGLTDEEISSLMRQFPDHLTWKITHAIEAKLKEKNGGQA